MKAATFGWIAILFVLSTSVVGEDAPSDSPGVATLPCTEFITSILDVFAESDPELALDHLRRIAPRLIDSREAKTSFVPKLIALMQDGGDFDDYEVIGVKRASPRYMVVFALVHYEQAPMLIE